MSNRCHFSLMMMTAKTDLTKIQANDAKKIANVFIFQRFSTVSAVWFYKPSCFSKCKLMSVSSHFDNFVFGRFWRRSYQNIT